MGLSTQIFPTTYWQKTRNELIAKVEQLGPFHLFWTLSCGEMRWPEIFTSILQDMEISGKFEEPLDINFGSDEDLFYCSFGKDVQKDGIIITKIRNCTLYNKTRGGGDGVSSG